MAPITITDFDPGASDGYDGLPGDFFDIETVASMLSAVGYSFSISPFDAGLMQLVQVGLDTVLQVDMNGHGNVSNFVTFANTQLSDFTATNIFSSTMIANWGFKTPAGQTITGDGGGSHQWRLRY